MQGTQWKVEIEERGSSKIVKFGITEAEARQLLDEAIKANPCDESLQECVRACLRCFGYSGMGRGDWYVYVSEYAPRVDTGEKHTCKRRFGMYWWAKPVDMSYEDFAAVIDAKAAEGPHEDTWQQIGDDRVCSHCGSLHPERVMELIRERGIQIVGCSDKRYKWYIERPEVRNAMLGGIKYYRQHDTPEFLEFLASLAGSHAAGVR